MWFIPGTGWRLLLIFMRDRSNEPLTKSVEEVLGEGQSKNRYNLLIITLPP